MRRTSRVARAAAERRTGDPTARVCRHRRFGLGAVQLAAPKGTLPHRTIGWFWVALMVTVAATSFFIHDLRIWERWSPIHLLSMFTLATLPLAVVHARRHRVERHRNAMISIFMGALVVAGLSRCCPAASCMPWCLGIRPRQKSPAMRGLGESLGRPLRLDDK